MFDLKLFLGFAADEIFHKELSTTNPYLISLFVGKEGYLQEISHQGRCYLGKYFHSFPTLEHIEDLEKHLVSILRRLAPRYPFERNPLVLVTTHVN